MHESGKKRRLSVDLATLLHGFPCQFPGGEHGNNGAVTGGYGGGGGCVGGGSVGSGSGCAGG